MTMLTKSDPYRTPSQPLDHSRERFAHLSTPGLVGIFFIPSLCFVITLTTAAFFQNSSLVFAGFCLASISGVSVSVFSAYVHTIRRQAQYGTLALFAFVYLLAQILALFISWFGLAILEPIFA